MKTIKTVRPDKKGRITLGPLLQGASSVRVSIDEESRIVLEAYAEVPLREAWLYENAEALESVRQGLRESAGIMINYLYRLGDIEQSHENYTGEGTVAVSSAIRSLARR